VATRQLQEIAAVTIKNGQIEQRQKFQARKIANGYSTFVKLRQIGSWVKLG
jgi:hypothetical protein